MRQLNRNKFHFKCTLEAREAFSGAVDVVPQIAPRMRSWMSMPMFLGRLGHFLTIDVYFSSMS